MLVKFDHLTYVVNRKDVADAIKKLQDFGYRLTISEDNAVNSPSKMQFLNGKDATHGLYFLAAPDDGGLSIELIAYEHTTQMPSMIDYVPGDNRYVINTPDVMGCKALLLAMGCEETDSDIVFSGVMELRPYRIGFQLAENVAHNLDNEGFCCPTIFIRPAHKTRDALIAANFECTDYEEFHVQDKLMFVFFGKNNSGELIEFVSNKL